MSKETEVVQNRDHYFVKQESGKKQNDRPEEYRKGRYLDYVRMIVDCTVLIGYSAGHGHFGE